MADIPITQFGIRNVEAAYAEVKTNALIAAPLGIVSFIAVALLVSRIVKVYRETTSRGEIDMRSFLELVWIYVLFAAIIMVMPVIIYYLEMILAAFQETAITALGGEPKGATATIIAEMEEMERRFPDGPDIFDSIPDIFAYFNVLYVKPFLALFIRYLYAMFITFRYAFLILLEIVFPIAFILLLDEKRSGYFDKWGANMIICYLMIPAFLVGNALADHITITIFSDPYTFIGILAQFFLKLFLLKKLGEAVFKVL